MACWGVACVWRVGVWRDAACYSPTHPSLTGSCSMLPRRITPRLHATPAHSPAHPSLAGPASCHLVASRHTLKRHTHHPSFAASCCTVIMCKGHPPGSACSLWILIPAPALSVDLGLGVSSPARRESCGSTAATTSGTQVILRHNATRHNATRHRGMRCDTARRVRAPVAWWRAVTSRIVFCHELISSSAQFVTEAASSIYCSRA